MSKTQNDDPGEELHDYHPIELAAHSILSNPLDSLHDNFELLHQSQFILLTRLKVIEQQIKKYQATVDSQVSPADIEDKISRISSLRKRLEKAVSQMNVVEERLLLIN